MNRPAPISVFSDQRRTKSTTWSRTSCGTQVAVRVPQDFFLKRCAPPSTRPGPRPWSAPSSPRTQSVSVSLLPGGEDVPSNGRQPLRSRRTLFASGRTPSVAGPVLHTDRKPPPCLKDGVVERPPSPQQYSACPLFSYVRSAILTDERSLHFQLRRDTMTQLACPAERFLDSVGAFSRRSSRKQPPLIHANADEQGRANTVKGVAVIRGADPNTIGGAIVGKVAVWCCQSDATPVAWFRPETAGSTLIVTVLLVPGDIVPSRQVTSAHCVQP